MTERGDLYNKAPLYTGQSHAVKTPDDACPLPNGRACGDAATGMLPNMMSVSVPSIGRGVQIGTSNALAAYLGKLPANTDPLTVAWSMMGFGDAAYPNTIDDWIQAFGRNIIDNKTQYVLGGRGDAIIALAKCFPGDLGPTRDYDPLGEMMKVFSEYLPLGDRMIVEGVTNATGTTKAAALNGNGGLQQVAHSGTFPLVSYKNQAKYGDRLALAMLPKMTDQSEVRGLLAQGTPNFVGVLPVPRRMIYSSFQQAIEKGGKLDGQAYFILSAAIDVLYPDVGRCVKRAAKQGMHMHAVCDVHAAAL